MRGSLVYLVFLLLGVVNVTAQDTREYSKKLDEDPCEYLKAVIDLSLNEAAGFENTVLIVVVSPGRSETERVSKKRADSLREYFARRRINPETYMIVFGEKKLSANGNITFFVAGKLRFEVPISQGRKLNFVC